jgi:hypothetical protein
MENITGNPVTNEDYLDTRLFLIEDLRDLLKKCSVIIEAPRRFGKTSVIKELIRQESGADEEHREFNILFLELEGEEKINDFCLKLFKELLNLYRIRKKIEAVGHFFGDAWNVLASRLMRFGISEIEIEIREKTREYEFSTWKEKIGTMITGLNTFQKKTIIVFDEFPDMLMNFKKQGKGPTDFREVVDSLTGWLRSLRQTQDKNCKYQFVFCGSINLRKTLEGIGIGKRINDLETFVIPPMEKDEARGLIEALTKEYGMEIDQGGIRFMVSKITNGSPYYGQILFKAFREAREETFDSKKVRTIYEAMLRGGNHDLNHFHSRLEDYLSPLERECSRIILRQLCYDATHEKTLYDLYLYERCDYEVFQSIVNRLIYEGYIMRDTDDNGNLRFVSPLLKDWWAYKVGVN